MKFCTVAVVLFSFWASALGNLPDDLDEAYTYTIPTDPSVIEDGKLSMVELITKYGYPVEKHTVQTEDGYLLSLYRIPYGKKCQKSDKPKIPVLLQHGLFSSSFDYLIMGPRNSLGYLLADDCYDVWLGNNRGNYESKAHIKYNTTQKEFWSFSWHEMGIYDVPAFIDHILNATQQPSLHYIGHSQGTTQFFVMSSLRPEYHSKIRSMHCLSPVAYMKDLASPIVRLLTMFSNTLQFFANALKIYELFPNKTILNVLGLEACKNQYPELQFICSNVMFLLCGFDEQQMNKTMLPAIIGHTPAGTGSGPVIHYAQSIRSGEFRQFDYGEKQNRKIYNSKTPPRYPVEKINVPIALYYGANDFLASLKDVKKISEKLPKVIENYLVPFPKFNHLDFLYAIDMKRLVYDRLFKVLKNY